MGLYSKKSGRYYASHPVTAEREKGAEEADPDRSLGVTCQFREEAACEVKEACGGRT